MTAGPGWDGRGLPPGAQARIQRATTRPMRNSLTGVGGLTALGNGSLGGARFHPVGEVMGSIVEHIGWQGFGGCGAYGWGAGGGWGGPGGAAVPVVTSGGGYAGFAPYVDALYRGWDTSLHRMLLEAQGLGADGVVGVRWTWRRMDEAGNREFTAIGTAVRAASDLRPAHLFATDLSAADVAKLLAAGHAPSGLAVGISIGVRHDDWTVRSQASSWNAANTEIGGYTELESVVRHEARVRFHERAQRLGGDVATVSGMGLRIWEVEPAENHRDHVAEATVVGTVIASAPTAHLRDDRSRPAAGLPLRRMCSTDRRTRTRHR